MREILIDLYRQFDIEYWQYSTEYRIEKMGKNMHQTKLTSSPNMKEALADLELLKK